MYSVFFTVEATALILRTLIKKNCHAEERSICTRICKWQVYRQILHSVQNDKLKKARKVPMENRAGPHLYRCKLFYRFFTPFRMTKCLFICHPERSEESIRKSTNDNAIGRLFVLKRNKNFNSPSPTLMNPIYR